MLVLKNLRFKLKYHFLWDRSGRHHEELLELLRNFYLSFAFYS